MGSVSCLSCVVYDYIQSPEQQSFISLSCPLSFCNSLLVTVLAEHPSFFHLEGVFHGSTLFPRKTCVLGGSLSTTDNNIPGNLFQVSKVSFLNRHKNWMFLLRLLSCMVTKIIIFSHQRGSFPLCPRSMWWEIKPTALVHTALAEFTLPKPCVSLICSSTQFLLLQTQLTYLILSDILLIVSFSDILVQVEISS